MLKDEKQIECAGWIQNSCDDGPGIRSVLFLQGCTKGCKECHNAKIQEHGKGKKKNITELVTFIDSECCNKKITISGGEPLEQLEAVMHLVKELKSKQYNICVYTGWDIQEVPKEIFKYINYIKTGEFIKELADIELAYVGSSNQKMYKITENEKYEEMEL